MDAEKQVTVGGGFVTCDLYIVDFYVACSTGWRITAAKVSLGLGHKRLVGVVWWPWLPLFLKVYPSH